MSDLLKGLFGGGDGREGGDAHRLAGEGAADHAAHAAGEAAHDVDEAGRKAARQARKAERAALKALSPEERDHVTKQAEDFVQRYTTGDPFEGYTEEEAVRNFLAVSEYATPEQLERATHMAIANLPENQRAQFGQMLEQRKAGQNLVDISRSGQVNQGGKATAGKGGGNPGDLFGGILGGLLGAPAGAPAQQQGGGGLTDILTGMMTAPGHSNQSAGGFADILGTLMGAPAQPQRGGANPMGDILSTMMGGGMAGGQRGGANPMGDILSTMMGGQPQPQPQQRPQPQAQQGGGMMSSPLTKAVLGGIAAFAMKEILSGKGRG